MNPDHPVFDLVPRALNNFIQGCYEDLGRPPITRQSAWTVYLDLYDSMQRSVQVPAVVRSLTDGTDPDEEPLPLLENQNDLFFMRILMVLTIWVAFTADKVLVRFLCLNQVCTKLPHIRCI